MMKRETILRIRWVSKKFGYHPSLQHVQTLVDSHLEALDRIESQALAIKRVEDLAAQYRAEAARPENHAALVSIGIAASIENALKGESL